MDNDKKTLRELFVKDEDLHKPSVKGAFRLFPKRHDPEESTRTNSIIVEKDGSEKDKKAIFTHAKKWLDEQVSEPLKYVDEVFGEGTLYSIFSEYWDESEEFRESCYSICSTPEERKEWRMGKIHGKALEEYKEYKENKKQEEEQKQKEAKENPAGHYFPQLNEKNLIKEDMSVNYGVLRGTFVFFSKDVNSIRGPSLQCDESTAMEAYNRYMMQKFGDEWVDFLQNRLHHDKLYEQFNRVWEDNVDFRNRVLDKYSHAAEELEGNSPPDDETEDELEGNIDKERKTCPKCLRGYYNIEKHYRKNPNHRPPPKQDKEESTDEKEEEDKKPTGIDEWTEQEGVATNGRSTVRSAANDDSSSLSDFKSTSSEKSTANSQSGRGKNGADNESKGTGEKSDSSRKEGITSYTDEYGAKSEDDIGVKRPRPKNEVIHGNSAKVLRELGPKYIDTCICSPPYWALRDYEGNVEDDWDDGEWHGQLGHEPTPDLFVKHLADIFDGVKRVLKPEGSCWVNLGDTYGGKSGGFWDDEDYEGGSMGHEGNRPGLDMGESVPEKCLAMVPQRFALEMISRGWILRNKVVWAKQVVFADDEAVGATLPTAAKDRVVEKSAEMFYHFVKQKDYYYDLDSIRRPHKTKPGEGSHYGDDAKMTKTEKHGDASHDLSRNFDEKEFYSEGGANLPRVWQINIARKSDEHYAGYPERLVERPILATCPPEGIVLDPFAGTGTTLRVAEESGRNWLGVEFSEKYVEIARRNVTGTLQSSLVVE